MADTFQVETGAGFRRVEFDPDVLGKKDVRILVDGQREATMPMPTGVAPFQSASFNLDGHAMTGIAFLGSRPPRPGTIGVEFDLYADGRSLSDGSVLADAPRRAAKPGGTYPGAFQALDSSLRIIPAAGAPGLGIALARNAEDLGLAATLGLGALLFGSLGLGTAVAAGVWRRVRARHERSIRWRAAIGWAAVIGAQLGGFAIALVIAAVVAGQLRSN